MEYINSDAEENRQAKQWMQATPLYLSWRRFQKHKVALIAFVILLGMYGVVIFSGFFAPYDPLARDSTRLYLPPQPIYIFDSTDRVFGLFTYDVHVTRDPVTLRPIYTTNFEKKQSIKLFVQGDQYNILPNKKWDIHLFGTDEGRIYVFGSDELGRDLFSRIIYGGRISLFIGLFGVSVSFIIGILLGGISGYFGGVVDLGIQRLIEFLSSMPTIPLWMALSAALPPNWTSLQVYLGITCILALASWGGLARVVRGQIMKLRGQDFVMAARLAGSSDLKIITWHMLPSIMSYLIVSITLSIPGMILGETALSFLGLGLRPPTISWGVLLRKAQNLQVLTIYPWLLLPALFVIVVVLCFNFVGDGLRDAADPYSN